MKQSSRDQTITLLADADTKAKARRLAQDSCRTLSGYVCQLLHTHIREQEALHGPLPGEEPPPRPLCPAAGRDKINGI